MIRDTIFSGRDLSRKSEDVPIEKIGSSEIQRLIIDMKDTLAYYSLQIFARAIAACQIGEYKNIIVVKRFRLLQLYDVYINLRILEQHGNVKREEGCISLPNIKRWVKRPKRVKVSYYDKYGNFVIKDLRGILAQIISHEYDHTIGKTIIERNIEMLENNNNERCL